MAGTPTPSPAGETHKPIEYPPYDESMIKQEIMDHMNSHHRYSSWAMNTKTTKADWITAHDRIHNDHETGTPQQVDAAVYSMKGTVHLHRVMSMDDVREAVANGGVALDLDKPLTAAEAGVLKGLIDNDFKALQQDMRAMAADTRTERLAEIEKEWSKKKDKQEFYRAKAIAQMADYRKAAEGLKERARVDGIELFVPDLNSREPQTTLVGKSEALKRAGDEVAADLNRALMSLERQRLAAQRSVMLARVTVGAQKVLDMVPNAKTLMIEAAKEQAEKNAAAKEIVQ